MDFSSIIQSIESSGIGEWMRTSVKAMPVVEAVHVMAIATVFGSIFVVDLRLLGFSDTRRPYSRVAGELLRWTWAAFVVAVVTGAMMFAANATTYAGNTPFQLKMLALVGAGVNMSVFHFVTARDIDDWDRAASPPLGARAAGALSILIWTAVIFLGRWIGFTKGYDFTVPDDVDFDFSAVEAGVRLLVAGAGNASP